MKASKSGLVAALAVGSLLASGQAPRAFAQAAGACAATPSVTEGPYYKAGAPQRSNLAATTSGGTRLTLTGQVLDASCHPLAGAVLDVWQADANGAYDNSGYTLRGRVTADARGRYALVTVVPGEYPGRTEHIHVKVSAPGHATLTTQLYFPKVAGNARDGLFNAKTLVKDFKASGGTASATFTFVLR
ncbi:MAG TPA: hypothetical protein VHN99_00720 [Deinococcales bacterium]|nr:hypothetical protein [Deinococcales bacterium]